MRQVNVSSRCDSFAEKAYALLGHNTRSSTDQSFLILTFIQVGLASDCVVSFNIMFLLYCCAF